MFSVCFWFFFRWHETWRRVNCLCLSKKVSKLKPVCLIWEIWNWKEKFREGKVNRMQQVVDQLMKEALCWWCSKPNSSLWSPFSFCFPLLWKYTSLNILSSVRKAAGCSQTFPTLAPSRTEAHVSVKRRADDWPQICGSFLSSQKAVAKDLWRLI